MLFQANPLMFNPVLHFRTQSWHSIHTRRGNIPACRVYPPRRVSPQLEESAKNNNHLRILRMILEIHGHPTSRPFFLQETPPLWTKSCPFPFLDRPCEGFDPLTLWKTTSYHMEFPKHIQIASAKIVPLAELLETTGPSNETPFVATYEEQDIS